MSVNTWISSDHHLGEDRFAIMQRPFHTVDEHNAALINNHNSKVNDNDIVIFNGDVMYQKCDLEKTLPLIAQMKGRKTLIRGNHDRPFSDDILSKYFERIIPEGEGLELEVDGIPCYVTHYPTCSVKDRFNLTGHIHGAWKFQLNMLNVGVDVNHYYPLNLNEIPFFLRAITEFYDNDVWVAYNEVNSSYFNTRGKKSNYFVKS